MKFETLLYEENDGVAVVTLNRPEVLNAFNQQMQAELRDVWRGLRSNDDVRAVVLTGAGEKAFCSGIDRDEAIADDYLFNDENVDRMHGLDGAGLDAVHVQRPRDQHQPEDQRSLEADRHRRERHGLWWGALPAGRVGRHCGG